MVLNRCRWFDRMYRLVLFLINTYGTEMNPLDGEILFGHTMSIIVLEYTNPWKLLVARFKFFCTSITYLLVSPQAFT